MSNFLNNIPKNVLKIIFSYLNYLEKIKLRLTCQKFKKIIDTIPTIEQCIVKADYYNYTIFYKSTKKIYYHKQLALIVNDLFFIKEFAIVCDFEIDIMYTCNMATKLCQYSVITMLMDKCNKNTVVKNIVNNAISSDNIEIINFMLNEYKQFIDINLILEQSKKLERTCLVNSLERHIETNKNLYISH